MEGQKLETAGSTVADSHHQLFAMFKQAIAECSEEIQSVQKNLVSLYRDNAAIYVDSGVHLLYKLLCQYSKQKHSALTLEEIDKMEYEDRRRMRHEELVVFAERFSMISKDVIDVLSVACDVASSGVGATLHEIGSVAESSVRPILDDEFLLSDCTALLKRVSCSEGDLELEDDVTEDLTVKIHPEIEGHSDVSTCDLEDDEDELYFDC